jgi:hypothetical protein
VAQGHLWVVADGEDKGGKKAFNSFDLVGSEAYSVDKFYTRSTNKHDHSSEKIQTPYPPNVHAMIMELVNDAGFPDYRSPQDVARDAVVHRIWHHANKSNDEKTLRLCVEEMLICEQAKIAQRVETLERMVAEARQTFEKCHMARDDVSLRELLDLHEERVEELQQPYKGQVAAMIEQYRRYVK